MAILKFTNISSNDIGILNRLDKYICDPCKTIPQGIGSRGCSPANWVQKVKANKHLRHSVFKRQLRHFVVGFDPHDKISHDEAVRVADAIAKYFKGHCVKYAVHRNTEHLHIHFIVDNTSYIDGKQLDMSKSDLTRFKEYCSEALTKYGCSKVRMAQHFRYDGMPDGTADSEELEIGDEMYLNNAGEVICEPVSTDVPEIVVSNSGSYTKPSRVYVNNYYSIYNAPREYIQNQTVTRQSSSGFANSHNHQKGGSEYIQQSIPHYCRSDTVKDSNQNERHMSYFEKDRRKLKSSGRQPEHQSRTEYIPDYDEQSAAELECHVCQYAEMPMDIPPDEDCSMKKGFFDRKPASEQRLTPFIPLSDPAEAKVYVVGTPVIHDLSVIWLTFFDYQSAEKWLRCNPNPQFKYTIYSLEGRLLPFNML